MRFPRILFAFFAMCSWLVLQPPIETFKVSESAVDCFEVMQNEYILEKVVRLNYTKCERSCLYLKVCEWDKVLLERQQDLMSVILSKKDMEIGRFISR